MHVIVCLGKKMHISNFKALPCVRLYLNTRDGVGSSLQMYAVQDV